MVWISTAMTFFGLDIGSSSLKAVEVKRDGMGVTLQLYASVALNSNTSFLAASEGDLKALSSSIKEFVESYPFSSNKVIVALPESKNCKTSSSPEPFGAPRAVKFMTNIGFPSLARIAGWTSIFNRPIGVGGV